MIRIAGLVLLAALGVAAPFVIYPVFLMKALCFALFACAFNLLLGYAGLLSFGHAAFFGGAAYVTGHAVKVWGFPPELGLLAGAATGAFLGFIFGVLASRRQGIYFAMITFGLSQMVYFIALQAPFTGGEDGIQTIPRGHLLGLVDLDPTLRMYFFCLGIFVLGLLAIHRIVHSPFGRTLAAIRENEPRAISLGYKVNHYKVLAFVLSAALSGLAGGLKSLVFGIATLTDVYWHTNGDAVLMALLGGVGTMLGPVVGAFMVVGIQNYFAELGAWVTMIQAVIFIVVVLAFRRGIVGELAPLLARLTGRGPATFAAAKAPIAARSRPEPG